MDPYRAPQPLPPPLRDALRPVLIGAGVVAGLIAVAALGVYVAERMERPTAATPRAPKVTTQIDLPPPPREERPVRKYGIAQGIVIDGTAPAFAIFPAGENKHAITMFKTESGHYEVELLARSYDLCWGGDPEPLCNLEVNGRKVRVQSCPSDALDCTCRSPDRIRVAWRAGCERVRVDSVTHVSATGTWPSHASFTCEPADACAKADVNPDGAWR